jgi:hypothetical protein
MKDDKQLTTVLTGNNFGILFLASSSHQAWIITLRFFKVDDKWLTSQSVYKVNNEQFKLLHHSADKGFKPNNHVHDPWILGRLQKAD